MESRRNWHARRGWFCLLTLINYREKVSTHSLSSSGVAFSLKHTRTRVHRQGIKESRLLFPSNTTYQMRDAHAYEDYGENITVP